MKRGEFRWVTVGAPGQDLDVVLSQPHGGRSQEDGDALLELVTKGSIQAAIFVGQRSRRDLRACACVCAPRCSRSPKSQPWGARDCAVRDPSGNLIRIAQA